MFASVGGRSVIVTGASKGIGRGIALRFGLAGCRVLVVSRKLREAEAVAAEIVAAGGTALGLVADVSRRADMQALADAALESFGRLHILRPHPRIFPPPHLRALP